MRKWKRVETADGARFRSALAAHEAALLQSLVNSLMEMLVDRETSSPTDELEELTGMRTGHSQPPEDDTMMRLLPDFFRPQHDHPAGSRTAESLNSALRSLHEPEIIDAKRHAAQRAVGHLPAGGGKFEIDRGRRALLGLLRQRRPAGAGHHARDRRRRPRPICRRSIRWPAISTSTSG